MNPSIELLLDLQVIDKRRLTLKKAREQSQAQVGEADKAAQAAEAAATAAAAEVEKMGALIRQYTADSARCDTTIAELRSQQMNAKTNKDYMAIINSIELTKVEKANREQSVKDLSARVAEMEAKATAAKEAAAKLKTQLEAVRGANLTSGEPSEDERQLQAQYDAIKAKIDPAFLQSYERLVKANHKMPLMRIDPKTRSTVYGGIISHNVIEQIRMGKLAIDRGSNAILYVDEKGTKPEEKGKKADG
jgi:predicted  nucleic acid-binding Zn-ribbon protein